MLRLIPFDRSFLQTFLVFQKDRNSLVSGSDNQVFPGSLGFHRCTLFSSHHPVLLAQCTSTI